MWDAADALRANSKLTAAEYKDPVLGLVLLCFAQNRYEEAKPIVESKIPKGQAGDRASIGYSLLAKHGFKNIKNYSGGMNEWINAGNPVVTEN